ncbi:MAG: DUF262 domain-containing protein [Chloroflexi bacterium]|nr:DUF262 domain-containing protein [Chloroflexota bacterium]
MDRTDSRTYSVNDFREWNNNTTLVLAPKFQRRSVWTEKARSYLIDTVLRDLPMPKVFMRQYINDAGQTIRELVDGQQRIRTILSYLQNGFPVMPVHGGDEFGGKYYNDLPQRAKNDFLNYNISVDVLIGATDVEVLGIFARLNTYGVRLNTQELINAKYFGYFKETVYSLGFEFYRFWVENDILSETDIARMLEAQLTSELVIAMLVGIQSRKVVENYYRKYDDDFADKPVVVERFKLCMDIIGEITENRLRASHFSSSHLFYSLYCAIYDLLYGLPQSSTEQVAFDPETVARVRATLWDIDALFEQEYESVSKDDLKFVEASTRRTTDLTARRIRHQYLVSRITTNIKPRHAESG